MYTFTVTIRIAAPAERCFDLARSIDAHVASTDGTGEVPVAGRTSGLIEAGEQVTWRAKHLGVTQHLTVRIVSMDRPRRFSDEMVRGAFKTFEHDHEFREVGGGTEMVDVIRLAAPLGPLGWLAERLFLGAYMRRFIIKRAEILKQLAERDDWRKFLPA